MSCLRNSRNEGYSCTHAPDLLFAFAKGNPKPDFYVRSIPLGLAGLPSCWPVETGLHRFARRRGIPDVISPYYNRSAAGYLFLYG